jgi:UDP-N-Acetylglucosamine 2-epimerase (EC 5.1.3.14)
MLPCPILEAGTAWLAGIEPGRIVAETAHLLEDSQVYKEMARSANPVGMDRLASGAEERKRISFAPLAPCSPVQKAGRSSMPSGWHGLWPALPNEDAYRPL